MSFPHFDFVQYRFFSRDAMDWIVSPQNPYAEVLTPNLTAFSVRNWWRLSNVIKVEPWSNRITVLIRGCQRGCHVPSLSPHRRENTERRQPLRARRELSRNGTGWHLDLGLLSLQNFEKINSCLSHTVCGSLLWQLDQAKKTKCFKYLQAQSPVACIRRRPYSQRLFLKPWLSVWGCRVAPHGPSECQSLPLGTKIYSEKFVNAFEDEKCWMERSAIKAKGE